MQERQAQNLARHGLHKPGVTVRPVLKGSMSFNKPKDILRHLKADAKGVKKLAKKSKKQAKRFCKHLSRCKF